MQMLKLQEQYNGHGTADWREAAMSASLEAEATGGNGTDTLLQAIRGAVPEAVTLLTWQDRSRVIEFLQQQGGFRQILSGQVLTKDGDDLIPYLGWFLGEWSGAELEIILPPSGSFLCIGADRSHLRRFCSELTDFAERPAGRCLEYSNGWRSSTDLDNEAGKISWDDVVLEPRLLAGVREAVESFALQRDAFEALGFPWRRGILLVGPPGTGKTMLCRAAVTALREMPLLYVRDMRDWCSDSIRDIFARARKLAPCVLALEDIDGFVNDSNRSIFLNELDGMKSNHGVLVIASSNHPGQIDEALLKRPSRFDRVFHIGLPGIEERREFCVRLLSRSQLADRLDAAFDRETLAQTVAERTDGFTPAYLKEAFIAAALERAQAGAMRLDEEFGKAVLRQVKELAAHLKRLRNPEALAEFLGTDSGLGFSR
jgi:hypothetical protein